MGLWMRRLRRSLSFCCGALLLGLLVSCAHGERPEVASPEVPASFSTADPEQPTGPQRWWESFEDPRLTELVETSMRENLDLRQAWARIDQLEAVARQQGSASSPQVSLDFSAARNRTFIAFLGSGALNNSFTLSAAASYEVDLWGRLESLEDAAVLDIAASRGDLETIAMTVAAQVADTWYGVIEQRALLALLTQQIATNERLLELTELRFGQGLATALDVLQQRQQLLATRAQVPQVTSRLQLQAHQLDLLLGRSAGSLPVSDTPDALPELSALPSTGVPSEVLQRRPDVRAATLRVAAADKRVAAAIADRFPAIRLTGSTGYSANNLSELIDQWIWSIAGGLVLPLIDGGRRAAEVDRQHAALRERLLNMSAVTLQAFKEVEDALVAETRQREFLRLTEDQLDVARTTLDQAEQRYLQGLNDFLPVLTALQSVQRTEQTVLSARRQLISQRIQLHRALGGDWTAQLADPARPQDDEPKEAR